MSNGINAPSVCIVQPNGNRIYPIKFDPKNWFETLPDGTRVRVDLSTDKDKFNGRRLSPSGNPIIE